MRISFVIFLAISLLCCTPKGPLTFDSPYIGKHKNELISKKGTPAIIKKFENSSAYVYTKKEEYYGKSGDFNKPPKKTYQVEYIYYVNSSDIIYKYQIWKKKVK